MIVDYSLSRSRALELAQKFVADKTAIVRATLVGSWVRDHQTVNDIDILLQTDKRFYTGHPYNLFYATAEDWECGILHWSLGKAIIHHKQRANQLGYKLSQHGFFKKEKLVTTKVADICQILKIKVPDVAQAVLDGKGRLL